MLDPRSGRVRYVGKTVATLPRRLNGHLSEARRSPYSNRRLNWLRSLIRRNLRPAMRLLQTVPPDEDWAAAEQFWIAKYDNLTNGTVGGEGATGRMTTDETRLKISQAHKRSGHQPTRQARRKSIQANKSQSSKAKRAATMSGRKQSPEHAAKSRVAKRGHIASKATRQKQSQALRGRKFLQSHRQKLAESRRAREDTRLLTYCGETLPAELWAKRAGLSKNCVYKRLDRGWTVEKTLSTPARRVA